MSSPIICPYCGHTPPPNRARLGAAVHCERCQKIYAPRAAAPPVDGANPFAPQPANSQPKLVPLVQPEMVLPNRSGPDVDAPSNASAFLAIFLVVGLFVVLCGGIGGYIAIKARERIVAKVNEVEKIQKQRQAELEARPAVPRPVRRAPDFKPPEFKPPPPVIPPGTENRRATPPPTTTTEPPKKKVRPPRPPATMRSLDELVAELNDGPSSRPGWSTLHELARLPVQENRKADVASALNRHLQSADTTTATAAAKAAVVWGTEQNADALLALIDSPHALLRWDAMRALAKVRPTAETAELLLAQAGEASNGSALRDAMKELGPIGEQSMLDCLATDDRRVKQSILQLLGETGTKSAIPALEKIIGSESDFFIKSQTEHALRRIKDRNP